MTEAASLLSVGLRGFAAGPARRCAAVFAPQVSASTDKMRVCQQSNG